MNGWKSSLGLLVLGIVLLIWGAWQFSSNLREAFTATTAPTPPLEKRRVDIALPEGLALSMTREPTSPAAFTAEVDLTQAASAETATAEVLAGENTFLGGPENEIEPLPHLEAQELYVPDRIMIPTIELDAPVVDASAQMVEILEKTYPQWLAPNEFAAGWHTNSAGIGQHGNLVLNGHHNVYGEVFARLADVEPGDDIILFSGSITQRYQITNKMILPEKYEPLDVRLDNARWLQDTEDERLTLVTCWPHESNTHRLIIVAQPIR